MPPPSPSTIAAILAALRRYDLQLLSPGSTSAFAINNSGRIAGGSAGYATIWFLSSLSSPKVSSLQGSKAFRSVNDVGDAVTLGEWPANGHPAVAPALVTANGDVIDLSTVVPDLDFNVNFQFDSALNAGLVVCGGFTQAGPTEGFIYNWRSGDVTRIPCPQPGGWTYCYGINRPGVVVGGANARAFIYSDGNYRDLGPGTLYDINDDGIAVGDSYPANADPSTATPFPVRIDCNDSNAVLEPVPLPTGYIGGTARAINSKGIVVGDLIPASSPNEIIGAFVYDGTQVYDLNLAIQLSSGWTLINAQDINDAGDIVGEAWSDSGATSGYVLTPVPSNRVPYFAKVIAFFLGGVTVDGGGIGFPIGPIGPWGPETSVSEPMREMILQLSTAELANFMGNHSARADIRKAAVDAAQAALNKLKQQEAAGDKHEQRRLAPRLFRRSHLNRKNASKK